jgi:hypothetical protein
MRFGSAWRRSLDSEVEVMTGANDEVVNGGF